MNATQERRNRHQVNSALVTLCQTYHPSIPLTEIDAILSANGFSATEPAIYCGRDGNSNEQVGERTWLSLTWHKMDVTGRYEIVAYVS
jgi:hypothetical protein